jgi:hypothetical protein
VDGGHVLAPLGAAASPYRAGEALEPAAFDRVRRALILDGCKWDPQVGDEATLAPFPLFLRAGAWRELGAAAEALAREVLEAEEALRGSAPALRALGIPAPLRRALCGPDPLTPTAARVMRFDFHWTEEGWRISEVNADVPGGYAEAWGLPRALAPHWPGAHPAGDPAALLCEAVARASGGGLVAVLVCPAFMEDYQVASALAARLRALGGETAILSPGQLRWSGREVAVHLGGRERLAGALIRFVQGEWLVDLPRRTGWRRLIAGGRTPVTNPGQALIAESKRFPLAWPLLRTPLRAWRRWLPETQDPRRVHWRDSDEWCLKAAFSNTGDAVLVPASLTRVERRRLSRDLWLHPGAWVAQRRFSALTLPSPLGAVYPCLGVYVVDGRAAGIYGRLARRALIDFSAIDVAVLVERE